MLEWIARHPLKGEFEPAEWSLVAAPIGKLSRKRVTDATWRSEGLEVLAWALGYAKIPRYDEEGDQQRAAKRLGFMRDAVALTRPSLIALAERRRYAQLARAIHWRLREVTLRRRWLDLQAVSRRLRFTESLVLGGVPLVDGDLALGTRTLHKAARADVQHALSIAAERHLAANWLIGTASTYSDVDTPT
jgi:hypothetical protein